jgi:Na+/H+ antiporter NhaD/arsenite permease-like protein
MILDVDRTIVCLCGAIITVIALMRDLVPFETIMSFLVGTTATEFNNFHIIVLIMGIMIITDICSESGVFSFIALKIIQNTRGNKYVLLFILCLLAFIFSILLNNILSMLILIPLTITVCKILNINPIPYIISQIIIANVGCLVFLISSFSNILVSSEVAWSFIDFFVNVGLYSLVLFAITSFFLLSIYKKKLEPPKEHLMKILKEYNAWMFVRNKKIFYQSLIILITTLVLFMVLPIIIPIKLDLIALPAGIILLILARKNIEYTLRKLDFQIIIYLLSIFIIADALRYVGLLDYISEGLYAITVGNPLATSLVILWLTAGLSSGIDNIPLAKILIPISQDLTVGFTPYNTNMVFRSMIYGIHLGDNFILGDNVVISIQIAKNYDKQIAIKDFFKIGSICTLIQLSAVSIYIVILANAHLFTLGFFLIIGIFVLISVTFHRHEIPKLFHKVNSPINSTSQMIEFKP